MIEIPRSRVRQFRNLLRKSALHAPRAMPPWITVQADARGLTLRAQDAGMALQFQAGDSRPPLAFAFPSKALDDFQGGDDSLVTLEKVSASQIRARWQDRGVPWQLEYDAKEVTDLPAFPDAPQRLADVSADFLQALDAVMQTAAKEEKNSRYGINNVQVRGGDGQLVGTDGRHLLIWKGFHLPFGEDVLIPRVAAFSELPANHPVQAGRTHKHFVLRVGSWTLFLPLDASSRFPNVEDILPESGAATVWRMTPAEADSLQEALPRLPGKRNTLAPITVELGRHVSIRAQGQDESRPTELILKHGHVFGPPVQACMDRQYLVRAIKLGFRVFHIVDEHSPLLGQDSHRQYIWMPLCNERAVAADPKPSRPPTPCRRPAVPSALASLQRRKPIFSVPSRKNKEEDARCKVRVPHRGVEDRPHVARRRNETELTDNKENRMIANAFVRACRALAMAWNRFVVRPIRAVANRLFVHPVQAAFAFGKRSFSIMASGVSERLAIATHAIPQPLRKLAFRTWSIARPFALAALCALAACHGAGWFLVMCLVLTQKWWEHHQPDLPSAPARGRNHHPDGRHRAAPLPV